VRLLLNLQKEESKDAVLLNPQERVAAVRPMWEQKPLEQRLQLLTADLETLQQRAKAVTEKARAQAGWCNDTVQGRSIIWCRATLSVNAAVVSSLQQMASDSLASYCQSLPTTCQHNAVSNNTICHRVLCCCFWLCSSHLAAVVLSCMSGCSPEKVAALLP